MTAQGEARGGMSIPQMLRRSADMLEANNDGMKALLAVETTLLTVQEQLYRARPGLEIDRLLGRAPLDAKSAP